MNLEDAVLLAVAEGLKTPKAIAEKLNVRIDDVEHILHNLEARGLVEKRIKGLIFKKEVYELTKAGFDRAASIREKLRSIADKLREAYKKGDRTKVEEIVTSYRYFVPLMLMLGLMDIIWISALYNYIDDFDINDVNEIDMDMDFDMEF